MDITAATAAVAREQRAKDRDGDVTRGMPGRGRGWTMGLVRHPIVSSVWKQRKAVSSRPLYLPQVSSRIGCSRFSRIVDRTAAASAP